MTFIGLEHAVHDGSLVEKVGEPCHMHRVEEVDFKEHLIADTVSVERHTFDERDVPDKDGLAIIGVPAVGGSEGMIDRGAQGEDVRINYHV